MAMVSKKGNVQIEEGDELYVKLFCKIKSIY